MANNNQNQKLSEFVISFIHSNGEVVKYVINRRNYYEAKEEAETLKQEINDLCGEKITGYDIKSDQKGR